AGARELALADPRLPDGPGGVRRRARPRPLFTVALGRGSGDAQLRLLARLGSHRQGPRGWAGRGRAAREARSLRGLPILDRGHGAGDISLLGALRLRGLAARARCAHEPDHRARGPVPVRDRLVREHGSVAASRWTAFRPSVVTRAAAELAEGTPDGRRALWAG